LGGLCIEVVLNLDFMLTY